MVELIPDRTDRSYCWSEYSSSAFQPDGHVNHEIQDIRVTKHACKDTLGGRALVGHQYC